MNPVVIMTAVAVDLALGDPQVRCHPVRLVGWLIQTAESILRRIGLGGLVGGILLVILIVLLSVLPLVALRKCIDSPKVAFIVDVMVIYFSIALGSLLREGAKIRKWLVAGDITGARGGVAGLCGRDTSNLNPDGIVRATVESVSENGVDAFCSPLFYAALFGPLGAWTYRVVNTLDSMVGYRTDRYIRFGMASARLDDILNYIPARITGLLVSMWAPLVSGNIRETMRVMFRYAGLHASPNAGWTEAATAGALRLRLGGPAVYFGNPVSKAYLGESLRESSPLDIHRACRLTVAACLTWTAVLCILRIWFSI